MIENPFISVVIPCYNDGKYLPETIEKLSAQTYQHFEIIIVNDGSTEGETIRVLNEINDPRISVLHKANGRMSSARNYGANHSRGELIAALDADDYFHPEFFEKAVQILKDDQKVGVVTSYIQMFGEFKKVAKPRGGYDLNFLFSNQCPACAVVRKDIWMDVGGYDESMKYGYEDWEFYIRITQKGWKIHVIPEKLLFYRQTKKSTHKNFTLPHRDAIIRYIVDKHKDWYVEKIKELMVKEEVIYTRTRISFPLIFKMLIARFKRKY
ncbi:MAG TPA: glycosyltransferase family A protein [Flavisolibacter sp.]|nr:glycosyltransferase family A protein [Flavisolibacter sp.]